MKKLTKLLFIVLFLATSTPAFAVKEFYGLSRSIRSLGMGGAFYGLSNDEYALFYNPAGLSVYETDWELMLRINAQMAPSTINAIKTLTKTETSDLNTVINNITPYQGTPLYAGVGLLPYYVRKHFAIGLLLADTKVDMALLGRDLDSSVDLTAISDSGLLVGYGRSVFTPNLHLGMNAKFIARAGGRKTFTVLEIAQNQAVNLDPQSLGGAGAGVDFDLGATYELPNLPFGLKNRASLVFSNLLASPMSLARQGNGPPRLSRMVSLGTYTVLPGWNFIDNFHLLIDFAEFQIGGEDRLDFGSRSGSLWKHVNFGVEMPIQGWFTVRTGFHQGYITAGLGVNVKYFKLDFATYAEEVSQGINRLQSRRFAVSIAFGAGSSPPAPITDDVKFVPVNTETEAKAKDLPKTDPKEIKEEVQALDKQNTQPNSVIEPGTESKGQ